MQLKDRLRSTNSGGKVLSGNMMQYINSTTYYGILSFTEKNIIKYMVSREGKLKVTLHA
jgi:hypothetical protein